MSGQECYRTRVQRIMDALNDRTQFHNQYPKRIIPSAQAKENHDFSLGSTESSKENVTNPTIEKLPNHSEPNYALPSNNTSPLSSTSMELDYAVKSIISTEPENDPQELYALSTSRQDNEYLSGQTCYDPPADNISLRSTSKELDYKGSSTLSIEPENEPEEKSIGPSTLALDNGCLSDFSDDDDDSVKDPDFSSSSSFSADSSSSNSSSSSSSSSDDSPGPGNAVQEVREQQEEKKKPKKNTRKRQRNDANYEKPKAKRLRNEGKEYVSTSKNKKVIPAKRVKEPCNDKCRYQCPKKVSEDHRLQIFNDYYNLSNINRKRDFLSKNMELIKPKYRYLRADRKKGERRCNYAFYFQSMEGKKIRVCKTFFKNTLDVNDRTILTVRNKTNSSGVVTEDMRGKHTNHKKVADQLKNDVRIHINSIPRIESHYLRAQTSKDFIDGSKTIAQLHRDYKLDCEAQGRPSVNYHMYADIFNREFNLSFFVPKKDQCTLCFQYNIATDQAKELLKNEYDEHLTQKVLSRREKETDKAKVSETFLLACFDMQEIVPIPKGDISISYYKSRLNTMNLTITEVGGDATSCYVWHEGEGGKGATEVGSCLLEYLEDKSRERNNEELEIVLYSDNCGAQQKNRFVLAVLMYAVQKFKIKRIYHKYLIAGHTQNEGDATHSVIEKEVAISLKSGPLFVPDQFITIIRSAKKKGNPYTVKELSHYDFLDVKKLSTDIGTNFVKNNEGETVLLTKVKVIKVEKSHPFVFFYKNSYSETEWKAVNVRESKRKNTRGSGPINISSGYSEELPNLQKAYHAKLPLNENKKKDLEFLLNKNYIPSYYSNFYRSLF